MATYLVTGSTGFLGTHVTDRLLRDGHTVVGYARSAKPREGDPRFTAVAADVLDAMKLQRALAGVEGVFHCAGPVSRDPREAGKLERVHVQGTNAVLAAARAQNVKRAVVVSTSGTIAVSDDASYVATEESPVPEALIARFGYYRAKLAAERVALAANAPPDFEVVVVNPSLLLGPGDRFGSSTGDVKNFLAGRTPMAPPGGMSFVDVRDAADATVAAMTKGVAGERYLLGGFNGTFTDFFARLAKVAGKRAPWFTLPRSPAFANTVSRMLHRVPPALASRLPIDGESFDLAQLYWYLDASRARRELGFAPRDPDETLRDTVGDVLG